jgi:hypothetical protein
VGLSPFGPAEEHGASIFRPVDTLLRLSEILEYVYQ